MTTSKLHNNFQQYQTMYTTLQETFQGSVPTNQSTKEYAARLSAE